MPEYRVVREQKSVAWSEALITAESQDEAMVLAEESTSDIWSVFEHDIEDRIISCECEKD
jgi:hypothetical protein